jgi:hypothetical protein
MDFITVWKKFRMLNTTANTWSKYQSTGIQVDADGKYFMFVAKLLNVKDRQEDLIPHLYAILVRISESLELKVETCSFQRLSAIIGCRQLFLDFFDGK